MKTKTPTKIITGICRMSYLYALVPHDNGDGKEPRYSVSLMIPKTDTKTIADVKAAIKAAYEDGTAKLRGSGKTVPPLEAIKQPLRDGDLERPDDPVYAGMYFINASNPRKPGIVDKYCRPIMDDSEIYSGMYGRASVSFYAFNSSGNRGIACGLNNLMKTADGERLSGGASAEEDFAEYVEKPDDSAVDTVTGEVISDGSLPF